MLTGDGTLMDDPVRFTDWEALRGAIPDEALYAAARAFRSAAQVPGGPNPWIVGIRSLLQPAPLSPMPVPPDVEEVLAAQRRAFNEHMQVNEQRHQRAIAEAYAAEVRRTQQLRRQLAAVRDLVRRDRKTVPMAALMEALEEAS